MNARVTAWLRTRDPRVLRGALAALLLLVALEGWLLVLRAPVTQWRSLVASQQAAEALAPTTALGPEIARLSADIALAEASLNSAAMAASDDDTVLQLISTFDRLASRHGVALGSVRAGGRRAEHEFERVSFEVEARGTYHALVDWLAESEAQITPLNVTELTLAAADEGRQVELKVKFSAYVPIRKAGMGT